MAQISCLVPTHPEIQPTQPMFKLQKEQLGAVTDSSNYTCPKVAAVVRMAKATAHTALPALNAGAPVADLEGGGEGGDGGIDSIVASFSSDNVTLIGTFERLPVKNTKLVRLPTAVGLAK